MDSAWLNNMARQYEIADAAHSSTLDAAAEDLARRLGYECTDLVWQALCTDTGTGAQDPMPDWLKKRLEVLQQVRDLMGEEAWQRLQARLDWLSQAADQCAAEIERAKGWSEGDAADALCSYSLHLRDKEFSGSFTDWLDWVEEQTQQIDAAANQYIELQQKQAKASEHLEAVSRHFDLEVDRTSNLLDAYAKDGQRHSVGFVDWALNGGLNYGLTSSV